MDAFSPGTHINRQYKNRHCAVNVIGGEIDNLYLSGIYRQDITANNDNPHCYIDGGRFSQVVSGGKEPIDGDVTFTIDHSLIKEFYGGGINSAKPVTGSISVTVDRSRIDKFCGGPMFGDMTEGKTVTTNATGSTFGVFYGAGNGGTNYAQVAQDDNKGNTEWTTNAEWGLDGYTKGLYDADNDCYLAKYEFQIFNLPAGDVEGRDNRRWYRYGAQFAATNTGSVTSTLTDCIVEGDFYGAGNLGGVIGDATSTLTGHTVIEGSAFGAGYSASIEPFQVLTKSNYRLPSRNPATGTIDEGDVGDSEEYIWTNETSLGGETLSTDNPMVTVDGVNYMYTTKSLLNLGTVTGQVTLKLEEDAQVMGNVFGGGNESTVSGNTSVVMKDRSTAYNVFGGGNKADVSGSVSVKIQGGTVSNDVYGGGALANTNVSGNPSDTTGVILTGGTVTNDVYGGGLGDALHAAIVYGDVTLSLNGTSERDLVADDAKGAIVRRLFGCNNNNGTPKGNVTVYVSGTQDRNTSSIKEKTDNQFDIDAVYGGGNLADYIPADPATSITNVIVEGCQRSRIRDVYGGGNAAAVSGTHVIVRGADSIDFVFGGGNGKDNIIVNGEETVNPGADIGIRKLTAAEDPTDFILFDDPKYLYADTTGNSIGTATVTFLGGNVNHIFGGSNTKGDVIKQAKVILGDENLDYCRFQVREVYGGANEAYMSGKASIEMKCVTGMEEIYGGARMADVEGGIELTITGGTYKKVFGGNNISGRINGPIKVNIEQTGCLPIIIEELYGGGNLAPYSIYGYLDEQEEGEDGISRYKPRKEKASGDDAIEYPDPEINIVSCERIDVVYGGGYKAAMVGSPTININMITGWTDGTDPNTSDLNQPHDMSDIGEIGDVFGGGNQAEVTGSTNVKIGTKETVTVHNIEKRVYTGILADSERVTAAPGYGASDTDRKSLTITVEGANITGNVYGGGNEADVTGDTNIQIGRSTQ